MMKQNIVVLSGAGISAESGLKTFRDSDGLWNDYKIEDVADINAWEKNKDLVLDFYNKRRLELSKVKPNAAHYALAQLENTHKVTIISQNIDNLHERAGSSLVIHLHGELTKVRPEKGIYDEGDFSEMEVFDIGYEPIVMGDKAANGQQLRPHVVWFGEAVPKMEKAISYAQQADILLIIGTSLVVQPAACLYRYVKSKVPIYLIDPAPLNFKNPRLIHIQEKATVGMQKFIELISS